MPEPIRDTSDPYIVGLLNIACKNPSALKGYSLYRVETHCTAVTYTAKVVNRDLHNTPTRYRIIHRYYETC